MVYLYIFGSIILISLIAVVAIIPLLMKRKLSENNLLLLVSLSAGTLFATAFVHLIPEAFEQSSQHFTIMLYVLAGILTFFIIEKFIHWSHDHKDPTKTHKHTHGHAYQLAPLNLIGDGLHNFIDGVVIASTYMVSIPLGVAATISVLFHEIPQEIADFGVLLYSGLSKSKAMFFNFLSALTAIIGGIVGIVLSSGSFSKFIIPFAAGNFVYIAGANLVPELHKHCKARESILDLIAMVTGMEIIVLLAIFMHHD